MKEPTEVQDDEAYRRYMGEEIKKPVREIDPELRVEKEIEDAPR